jgi:nicotinamidase/pyrazinamidase
MNRNVLIVVDMLNDFIDEKGALYCGQQARDIIPFIQQRLAHHRNAGDPVLFLADAHDPDDLEFEKFPRHCVAGTWGSTVIAELAPRASETVIAKKRYSGFYGTDLDKILAALQPATVEVVGVCTSICVMDTVGGLANRDYRIQVPIRGVADFNPEFHEFALKRMQQLYGAAVA